MKKAFLRAPVNFKYISSSFNPRRLHPVTGQVKAHRGIDYAARTGTPVVSSGNGKVIKAGYSKYNGNYVFISHGTQYVTKYLHLNKRLVRTGQKVKQGEKIGTVGSTGRVTGAHLHYEFLVNGVHRNPKTVKLPKSEPL
ncbi:peptidoglycan DD-metalloendopeptidase family protein, partial [Pseudoalteromonas ruthenica]